MKYLSMAKAKQLVRDAVERHPNRKNPMSGATCVYTCPNDPELHCIAGQVLVDAGIPLPSHDKKALPQNIDGVGSSDRTGWELVDKGYMTYETLFFLGQVQNFFDRATWRRQPWSMALSNCRIAGLL